MKSILTTLVFVLFAFTGYSQDDKKEDNNSKDEIELKTKYGVRLAYNISNLDFEPDPDFENKHRNNMAFGGFVDFAVSNSFSILTELQYSAEGGGKDETLRVSYIQLPVLFKLYFGENFSAGAGPMVGIKTWSYEDGYKNVAFSGVAGIEYLITDILFLDARFSYGFSNILDNDASFEAKNTNIQIGVGLKM
ncbi:porin family protein [Geojedonia litorea]|uniref:Porin family protein n=1 Tax=Geojedonia litorea TaxID=1268269 RepID=A0ABV9N7L4_9FLAO